mmetsp:Transcript_165196/g.524900  ORF Transcript_165196/g.524900 Transcript_165196/m.524900 type:complete len:432 (-) Transcript_165196:56-1351(-)
MPVLRFKVNAEAGMRENIRIVGASTALGGWNENAAIRLKKGRGHAGSWISDDVDFGDEGSQDIAYRVFAWSKENGIRWECENQDRVYSVRTSRSAGSGLESGVHIVALSFGKLAAETRQLVEWPLGVSGSNARLFAFRPFPTDHNDDDRDCHSLPAMVVFPGGGYGMLTFEQEGRQIAEWLCSEGVVAFVVGYSCAPVRYPMQLREGTAAVSWVRRHAHAFLVDSSRVGIMGFSAGAHLAGLVHTVAKGELEEAPNSDHACCSESQNVARLCATSGGHEPIASLAVLCYPVVTFDIEQECAHVGSRKNLLGDECFNQQLCRRLSLETRISSQLGPVFVYHTSDDTAVSVENSYLLAASLAQASVPHELHIYDYKGVKHGSGLYGPHGEKLPWAAAVLRWLDELDFRCAMPLPMGEPEKWHVDKGSQHMTAS